MTFRYLYCPSRCLITLTVIQGWLRILSAASGCTYSSFQQTVSSLLFFSDFCWLLLTVILPAYCRSAKPSFFRKKRGFCKTILLCIWNSSFDHSAARPQIGPRCFYAEE